MDRRGFLRTIGIGAGLAAVAPRLILPDPTTSIAAPERTVFLPPAKGWHVDPAKPSFYVHDYGTGSAILLPPPDMSVEISGYYDPDLDRMMQSHMTDASREVVIRLHNGMNVNAIMTDYAVDLPADDAASYRARYIVLPGSIPPYEYGGFTPTQKHIVVDGKRIDQGWNLRAESNVERYRVMSRRLDA